MSKIIAIILAIGCLIIGTLFVFNVVEQSNSYKSRIKELNNEMKNKDVEFMHIQYERDSLLKEREIMLNEIVILQKKKSELESKRNNIKRESDEKRNTINNSNIVELSKLLSDKIGGIKPQ
jgi:uncharacterized coiled-coil DUF342 family protein